MQDFIKKKKVYIIIVASTLFIIGGAWFYFNGNNDKILLTNQTSNNTIDTESFLIEDADNQDAVEDDIEKEEPVDIEIMVHIVGEVQSPGVVMVKEGTRLIEAIEKLGGPTDKADLEVVNLAMKVQDEEKIYIPKEGEVIKEDFSVNVNNGGARQKQQSDTININTATQEELKSLPGIGDSISASIIEYRESNGGFKSIEDIKNVNRIGDKIFLDIKEKISI